MTKSINYSWKKFLIEFPAGLAILFVCISVVKTFPNYKVLIFTSPAVIVILLRILSACGILESIFKSKTIASLLRIYLFGIIWLLLIGGIGIFLSN